MQNEWEIGEKNFYLNRASAYQESTKHIEYLQNIMISAQGEMSRYEDKELCKRQYAEKKKKLDEQLSRFTSLAVMNEGCKKT